GTMRVRQTPVKIYQCPSDSTLVDGYSAAQVGGWAGSSYAANFQVFGITTGKLAYQPRYTLANIPDGTSQVIALTEKYSACGSGGNVWAFPGPSWGAELWIPMFAYPLGDYTSVPQVGVTQTACDPSRPASRHSGALVALLDGSVRGVS